MQSYSRNSKLLTSVTSEVIQGRKPEVTVNMTGVSRGAGNGPEVTGYSSYGLCVTGSKPELFGYCSCGLGCDRKWPDILYSLHIPIEAVFHFIVGGTYLLGGERSERSRCVGDVLRVILIFAKRPKRRSKCKLNNLQVKWNDRVPKGIAHKVYTINFY